MPEERQFMSITEWIWKTRTFETKQQSSSAPFQLATSTPIAVHVWPMISSMIKMTLMLTKWNAAGARHFILAQMALTGCDERYVMSDSGSIMLKIQIG